MSDTATIAAIAEGLGWTISECYMDIDSDEKAITSISTPTKVLVWPVNEYYLYEFTRAVEAALSEAQQRRYAKLLATAYCHDVGCLYVEADMDEFFAVATAPASVRLACLRTVVKGDPS